MKSNSEICEDVVRRGVIEQVMRIHHVSAGFAEDLKQEVVLLLLEINTARLNDIVDNDKLEAFINRVVRNMWRSKTSRFYYKYRKNEKQTTTTADNSWLNTEDC